MIIFLFFFLFTIRVAINFLDKFMWKDDNIVYGNIIHRKRWHRGGEILNGNIVLNIIFLNVDIIKNLLNQGTAVGNLCWELKKHLNCSLE